MLIVGGQDFLDGFHIGRIFGLLITAEVLILTYSGYYHFVTSR
jgi:hypothetical protein